MNQKKQPSSRLNPVLSDIELLSKKHKEVKRLKLQNAGLIIFVMILASAIAAISLISRFGSPAAEPTINVIDRAAFDQDGSNIRIPSTYKPGDPRPTVTAGESFVYNTQGVKLEAIGGTVTYQINCTVKGVEQLTQIGSAYSNIAKGKFDTTRSLTIPISTRLENSDSCRLQTVAKYTFYQADQTGNTRPIDVEEIGISNYFKLIIPKEEDKTSAIAPTNQSIAAAPSTTPVIQAQTEGDAQPVTEPPHQTTVPKPPAEAAKPKGVVPEIIKLLKDPSGLLF